MSASQKTPGPLGAARRPVENFKGIFWITVSGLCFVLMSAIVRHLGSDMSPFQAAFIRYVIGGLFVLPLALRLNFDGFRRARWGLHLGRGLIHGVGVLGWFYAVAYVPIAEVTALLFTAPIFTTIGAAVFFGERLHAHRIAAALAGLAGAMVILRPGIEIVQLGSIAMLIAAPSFAISALIAKRLTEREDTIVVMAILTIFVTLMLLPPALMVWRQPTPMEMVWLGLIAAIATVAHYSMTQAIAVAELTVTQPFSFTQLVWATLIGYWAFGELPDIWTWIGAAIIVASVTYIAHRERLAGLQSGRRGTSGPLP
ncbi:MAG TPA: DMT family transporter [Alphaproteobacteria bacterium]|nr:DMT family transporter [Alphaproteobacteria bacterium]